MVVDLIIIIAGLIISRLLFFRFPVIKSLLMPSPDYTISIIIPARNEEKVLPHLLESLKSQSYNVKEIICVDDGSEDDTAAIAKSWGINIISAGEKPDGWTGKSWACHVGAGAATGELLLFVDADVVLAKGAVKALVQTYAREKCTISVMPFHNMKLPYEKMSFFFNVIQVGANGVTNIKDVGSAGLCGPIIMIPRVQYDRVGGHLEVKDSIVEDVALGQNLLKADYKYKLLLGGNQVSYRMYSSGFRSLLQGWLKNFSTGALSTPILIFAGVFVWVSSLLATVISLIKGIAALDLINGLIYGFAYILWVAELRRISYRVGNFSLLQAILYPYYFAFFILVFVWSLFKKNFRQKVVWKERKIKLKR